MNAIITYRDLDAWKRGMDVVELVYRRTAGFPREELYGLTSQIRRAAISIPSNIAEGHCRRTTKAYANHVSIALGSHGELETCVEAARRLHFLTTQDFNELTNALTPLGQILNRLYQALERKLQQVRAATRRARAAHVRGHR